MSAEIEDVPGSMPAIEENVEAIKSWDQLLLLRRSRAERIGDAITNVAASGPSILAHAIWFGLWIAINLGAIGAIQPFDKFPFPLLTSIVSLEAIFLALFVLASQNRMGKQSDLRANLDLQIDLLAEREMTTVLHLLSDIASHLDVKTSVTREQLAELIKKTDVERLTKQVDR